MQEFCRLGLAFARNVLECKGFVGLKLLLSPVWLPVLLLLAYVRVRIFQERIDLVGLVSYWILGRLNRSKRLSFALRLAAIIVRVVNNRKHFLRRALRYLLRHEPKLTLIPTFARPINISHRLLSIKHEQIGLTFSLAVRP